MTFRGSGLRAHVFAVAALTLLAGLLLSPLLAAGRAPYSAYSDVLAQHLATKQLADRAPRALPLWRDDQFGGAVALTNPQALYLHPLHALFWLMQPEAAVGPSFALALWVAALGSYAFARSLGASLRGGLFAGGSALVSAKLLLAVFAGWLAPLATIALVPWILFGVTHLCEAPSRARASVLSALCAVAFAGGTPQTVYYALLLSLPYAAFVAPAAQRRRHALTAWGWSLGACGLGLACSAYLWTAIASDASLLTRSASARDPDFFYSGHALTLSDLWTLFVPPALHMPSSEPWEEVAYFGAAPLALTLFSQDSRRTRYFGAALLASILLSLDTPLLTGLRACLPGYAQFRLPARMLFLTGFIAAALGGAGLDRLLRAIEARAGARASHCMLALLALGIAGEGWIHTRMFLETVPQTALRADADHPARALARRVQPGARVAVVGDALSFGWAADLGLRLVNGYDPFHYAHQAVLAGLLETGRLEVKPSNWVRLGAISRVDLLNELSVELVFSRHELQIPGLTLLATHQDVRHFSFYEGMVREPLFVYRNANFRAYARFARAVHRLPSERAVAERLASEPLHGQAYILGDASAGALDPQSKVVVDAYQTGWVRASTRSRARQLLVVAETFHPGWHARVDGREAPLMAANLALLGLWLEPGSHSVELSFRPPDLSYNFAVSGAAVLLVLGLLCLNARRPRAEDGTRG